MRNTEKRTSEIMSGNLITVRDEDNLLTAYDLMQHKKIRHLPVVGSNGTIVGIISDRDLQRAMTPYQDPFFSESISFKLDPAFKVKDFMSWPIGTIDERQPVLEAAKAMLHSKVSSLLVVGWDSQPKGIVTTDDLMKFLVSILEMPGDPDRKLLVEGLVAAFGNKLSYLD